MAFRLTRKRKLWDRIRPPVLGLATLALCLGAFDVPAARAQAFNPFGWFQQVFRPQQHNYAEYRPQPPASALHLSSAPDSQGARSPYGTAELLCCSPRRFAGELLGQALTTSLSDSARRSRFCATQKKIRPRPRRLLRLAKAAHDLATGSQKINVAVIMIGSNDHQTLHDATGSYDPDLLTTGSMLRGSRPLPRPFMTRKFR